MTTLTKPEFASALRLLRSDSLAFPAGAEKGIETRAARAL